MKTNSLQNEAAAIASAMYGIADLIETENLDEKWRTASKIKNAANDAYYYVAQVAGVKKGDAVEYDCINARKHLNTLKSLYVFAAKQEMVELEPALVVSIDTLVSRIDAEQEFSRHVSEHKVEEELKPWLEKYRIWQQISKD